MFPLIGIVEGQEQNGGDSYSSKGYRASTYWNIVFYNSENKEQRLLTPDRKLIITGYNIASSSDDSGPINKVTGPGTAEVSKLIFYKMICEDVNKNGGIDIDDPEYLFISDKIGKGFKQISPFDLSVTGWSVIDKTGLLLINARPDSNKDGKFDSDDRDVCYLYDLKNGGDAKPVFSKEFSRSVVNTYKKQWPVKK
ncbi:hypothetical protein [Mucilaginibacter myungsuensis]|uniref:Uncharacterized protein n=1 Tax=Mucilaginibacter myungsuensis TaxID=649104 RepID=A0A929KX97_9SPHI|nr:hypothetical protein [Mucilaginibacter myungsuensis]MBE9662170.1 hypothetical protein [Mucilaginibacter myungsuensis]MDN3599396.1 hypothetical protein [Mucilaginibacter myungsuensis]